MKVTLKFLQQQNACQDGINSFKEVYGKSAELKDIILYAIKSKKRNYLSYCNWLIVRKMSKKQGIQYAIFAAEQVINIYEKKYSEDKIPRKAIEAAKLVLKKNNKENRIKAKDAANAAYDAYDAAYAAAAYAAYDAAYAAAANAANAAAYAAYDAAYAAAANAANAAAYAAYDAYDAAYDAANAAGIKMQSKIILNGIKIIYKEETK
jgi:hypothetical protein